MTISEIIITIVLAVYGLGTGFFYGLMPLRLDLANERQNRLQQRVGLVAALVLLVVVIAKMLVAAWVTPLAMVVGFGIARIPAIHAAMLNRFALFRVDLRNGHKRRSERRGGKGGKGNGTAKGGSANAHHHR
ncbi:hypothetical protein [Bifidobacterium jacchi]|uniref:Uncharacterized protein n=1 Tax=Bifidobacterium jacchi TaxID=2490545 RepID=A0A5N5RJG7_9BIFI|nr:hypothetical protein [Bifidobacterium jacchi]KAB5607466.1 hypothetical protein EHS19_04690 [Bifidobacterium jacchi]